MRIKQRQRLSDNEGLGVRWVGELVNETTVTDYGPMPARLPVGRSTFRTLRRDGAVYVDKTAQIYELAIERQKFFLARPRRFGKTLLVSTFESLFRDGLRDFQGLAIEKLWQDKTYDVVTLDFSRTKDFSSLAGFLKRFEDHLVNQFGAAGFRKDEASSVSLVAQIDKWMQTREPASLVLLIDEYDAPLTACFDKAELFALVRDVLSNFYATVKGCEGCLRFLFMTGITKIENASIFSAFNPITDISLNPRFGSLLGYTEAELEKYFGNYLKAATEAAGFSDSSSLLAEMRRMYDGFCFDLFAKTHVYVPWSVLKFLQDPAMGLRNYWYDSAGKPTVLMNFLKSRRLATPATYAASPVVPAEWLSDTVDVASLRPEVLLAQTGYLTILESDGEVLKLGYPNEEMRQSMARLYTEMMLADDAAAYTKTRSLARILLTESLADFVKTLNAVVSGLSYQGWSIQCETDARNAVQMMLAAAGLRVMAERHNAWGRSDLEVEAGRRCWVFEMKWAAKGQSVERRLREAEQQMEKRHYGVSEAVDFEVTHVVLVFSEGERQFVGRMVGLDALLQPTGRD